MTDLFGPVPVRANLSARQAKELGLLTSGTFGRPSSTSSKSVALQSSLENRLRAATSTLGSTLFNLTWKPWVTPSGVSRFRLRASVRRTSGTALSGWGSPTATDAVRYPAPDFETANITQRCLPGGQQRSAATIRAGLASNGGARVPT
jgi:hypothetical protein